MISFGPTEEQELIRDTVRSFAEAEIREQARDCEESGSVPAELLNAAWELGLVNSAIPEACGGVGMDRSFITNCLVLEELGAGCAGIGNALMAPSSFINPILDFGTDEQKAGVLPAFTGGEFKPAALALDEPHFGFDATAMKTVARKKDAGWELSGAKSMVPFADTASHFLIAARNEEKEGVEAIEAFIVEAAANGLEIGESGEPKLGLNAVPTGGLKFDGLAVSGAARLGGDAGIDGARFLNAVRVARLAFAVGLARAVTEFSVPYAKEREAFGTAIGRKQAIAFMLADMYSDVETMRWMVWKAASALENGEDASKPTTLAENYVGRKAMRVADDGLQIFGGHGFIRELPLEMWYRNMRTLTAMEGMAAL